MGGWNGSDEVSSPRLRMHKCKKDLSCFFELLTTSWFASLHVMEQERVFLKKTLRQGEKTTLEVIRSPIRFRTRVKQSILRATKGSWLSGWSSFIDFGCVIPTKTSMACCIFFPCPSSGVDRLHNVSFPIGHDRTVQIELKSFWQPDTWHETLGKGRPKRTSELENIIETCFEKTWGIL